MFKKYFLIISVLLNILTSNAFAVQNKDEIITLMTMAFKQQCLYVSNDLKKDIVDCVEKTIKESPNSTDDDIAEHCILNISLTSSNFASLCM